MKDKDEPDRIIEMITDQLKTYGTRYKGDFDLDTVKVMAGIMLSYDTFKQSTNEIETKPNINRSTSELE
jgi:hypothetical protein